MTLREQVEELLPGWEQWYPSLFDAALDLGLIKAMVCSPSSLLLSRRHSDVQSQAADAHRDHWGGRADMPTSSRAQPTRPAKPRPKRKPGRKRSRSA